LLEQYAQGIALGALYGLEAGIVGYMSGEDLPVSWSSILTTKFWASLSLTKLAKTVLVGMVVGAITNGYGFVSTSEWQQFTQQTGIPQIPLPLIINFVSTMVVSGVDRMAKFIIRRSPIMHGWNGIKSRILGLLADLDKVKKASAAAQAAQKPQPQVPQRTQ
jgi:hypothetical protein